VRVTAPGKVLWAGEYAVLDGAPAVVMAVDRRVAATLAPERQPLSPFLEAARQVVVERLGANSAAARAAERVQVDSTALSRHGTKLGLGSSAAATVAAVAAAVLSAADPRSPGREDRRLIGILAHEAHARAQAPRGSRGSGVDVAAALEGGVLAVKRVGDDVQASALPFPADLAFRLVWTGEPADTPSLVARVRAFRERDPAAHRDAIDGLAAAAAALAGAFQRGEVAAAIAAVAEGARALAELADRSGALLMPPGFAAVATLARAHGGAAKPTGAGGGDLLLCALPGATAAAAFGRDAAAAGMILVAAELDPRGVCLADGPESA
jgi:phosphomevalonate kinase